MSIIELTSYRSQKKYNYEDKIYLIQQFFMPDNLQRKVEIINTLINNCKINHFAKIILLNERIYTQEELSISDEYYNKIEQVNINKRLTFKDVFEYVYTSNLKGYIIFSNSDIFYDNTIINLFTTPLASERTFMAQLRLEYNNECLEKCDILKYLIKGSQDTWIYHTNMSPPVDKLYIYDFYFGIPCCDHKIMYLMKILGYNIINSPYLVRTYHYHKSDYRIYSAKNMIAKPWAFCTADVSQNMFNKQDIMYNNNNLTTYLTTKIETNKHFIIPKIGNIENEFAYYITTNRDATVFSNFESVLKIMKHDKGILCSTEGSIYLYANQYIQAFKNADSYLRLEINSYDYIKIEESHDFITKKVCKASNNAIYQNTLDIFNLIYSNPWTQALKGKRILIISPLSEIIMTKIPIREYIYGIDLFPECTFTFLTPPQTDGENKSKDWLLEFNDFNKELEDIKDTYDIALIDANGYNNLICNEIYTSNKSAISIGDVLRMYFGIINKKWELEQPDIIKLYKNEYWTSL